jgi:hypothetical protein
MPTFCCRHGRTFCILVGAVLYSQTALAQDSTLETKPAPGKSQYTLVNPTPIDLRRPYNTDRPSKTDSLFTIDAGVFQIESDVWSWTLDEPDTKHGDERIRTWIVGNTNFKLGLTNWMDLQVFPQFYVNKRTSGTRLRETARAGRLRRYNCAFEN